MSAEAPRRLPAKLGRKRNPALDSAILGAALDVLAEHGFAGMTMDATAERANVGKATVYRRWPSKVELVVDALRWMAEQEVEGVAPPDTGSFRGDMLALMRPEAFANGERRLRIMAGLASLPAEHQALSAQANAASIEPWTAVNRQLILRATQRGEFDASAKVDTLAALVPSLCAFRVAILRLPIDRKFLQSLIDGVLVPALRGSRPQ